MNITLLTTGTRGDTQPYIALGMELKKSGHSVRVAAFENYKTFVASHGLEFFPIRGDVSMVAASDEAKGAVKADNPLKLMLSFNKLKSFVFDLQKDFFDACIGADAVVYHPGASIGYFIARHFKIPGILATPFPMTPTKEFPALIFYDTIRLGKGFNYLTHKLFEKVMWMASSSPVKQFWKAKFGNVPTAFSCPFGRQNTKESPTIISCSKYVFPRPQDWSEYVYSPGYWFLEDEENWQPSAELLDFLQSGKPPVYVGFGSIGDAAAAAETTALVIDALKIAGQRGILATGWNGMSKIGDIPEGIFILESAPHTWLFPQMAAVVHHGGAGTTAAGFKAGVPSVIIPSGNDQFAWGRRAYELGVASKPIPRKKLTAEKLSSAIQFALAKEINDAAKELGEKIRSEKGVEEAAGIVAKCAEGL